MHEEQVDRTCPKSKNEESDYAEKYSPENIVEPQAGDTKRELEFVVLHR